MSSNRRLSDESEPFDIFKQKHFARISSKFFSKNLNLDPCKPIDINMPKICVDSYQNSPASNDVEPKASSLSTYLVEKQPPSPVGKLFAHHRKFQKAKKLQKTEISFSEKRGQKASFSSVKKRYIRKLEAGTSSGAHRRTPCHWNLTKKITSSLIPENYSIHRNDEVVVESAEQSSTQIKKKSNFREAERFKSFQDHNIQHLLRNNHIERAPKENLKPISQLILSSQEYSYITKLPLLTLQREEKYNWGHVKAYRTGIRNHKTQLTMCSQDHIPESVIIEKTENNNESLRRGKSNISRITRKNIGQAFDELKHTFGAKKWNPEIRLHKTTYTKNNKNRKVAGSFKYPPRKLNMRWESWNQKKAPCFSERNKNVTFPPCTTAATGGSPDISSETSGNSFLARNSFNETSPLVTTTSGGDAKESDSSGTLTALEEENSNKSGADMTKTYHGEDVNHQQNDLLSSSSYSSSCQQHPEVFKDDITFPKKVKFKDFLQVRYISSLNANENKGISTKKYEDFSGKHCHPLESSSKPVAEGVGSCKTSDQNLDIIVTSPIEWSEEPNLGRTIPVLHSSHAQRNKLGLETAAEISSETERSRSSFLEISNIQDVESKCEVKNEFPGLKKIQSKENTTSSRVLAPQTPPSSNASDGRMSKIKVDYKISKTDLVSEKEQTTDDVKACSSFDTPKPYQAKRSSDSLDEITKPRDLDMSFSPLQSSRDFSSPIEHQAFPSSTEIFFQNSPKTPPSSQVSRVEKLQGAHRPDMLVLCKNINNIRRKFDQIPSYYSCLKPQM
ncbi:hypothetical protein BY996DRAFT_6418237 [Phakopsora pachyrhizi]|nr:hypothetical protein BY996DRAFT_6418237 [Phakopsora pachyrhizi]